MPERVTEKWGKNPHHRKPKGSAARVIRGGLVGPKATPDGVGLMDTRLIFLDLEGRVERDVTLRGTCSGETCAVQAGREPAVSPGGVDREASARGGGNSDPSV